MCVPPVPSCVSVQRPSSLSISSSAAVIEVARAFASFPLLRCRNHLYYEVLCTTFDVEANKEIPILSSECRLVFVMQGFLESGFSSCWVGEVMLHFRTLAAAELKTSYLVHTLQRKCWTYKQHRRLLQQSTYISIVILCVFPSRVPSICVFIYHVLCSVCAMLCKSANQSQSREQGFGLLSGDFLSVLFA